MVAYRPTIPTLPSVFKPWETNSTCNPANWNIIVFRTWETKIRNCPELQQMIEPLIHAIKWNEFIGINIVRIILSLTETPPWERASKIWVDFAYKPKLLDYSYRIHQNRWKRTKNAPYRHIAIIVRIFINDVRFTASQSDYSGNTIWWQFPFIQSITSLGTGQCCCYLDSPSLPTTDCTDHHQGLLTWWYSHSQIHAVSLQRSSGIGYCRKTQPVFLGNWIIAVKLTRDLLSTNNSTICTPKRTRSGKITRCSVLEYSDDSSREMTTSLLKRSTQIECSVSLFWINISLFVSKIGIESSSNYELSEYAMNKQLTRRDALSSAL